MDWNNPVEVAKYRREWWKNHPNHNAAYRAAKRKRALEMLGNVCARCQFADERALQIDHINGGGTQQRKKDGNPRRILDRVLNGESGYQILCANCNWIKRAEEREYGYSPRNSQ